MAGASDCFSRDLDAVVISTFMSSSMLRLLEVRGRGSRRLPGVNAAWPLLRTGIHRSHFDAATSMVRPPRTVTRTLHRLVSSIEQSA